MMDTATANDTRTVVVERDFPHPADKLWRALTQPHLIAEWLMKNDFAPSVGHRFNLSMTPQPGVDIVIDCEVLAIEPGKSLAYTWNHPHQDPAYDLHSTVTFTLTPAGSGTHLRMEQTGFRPEQKQAIGGANYGWQNFFGKLDQVLAKE